MTNSRVLVLAVTACCFLAHTTADPLGQIVRLRLYHEDLTHTEFAAEDAAQIVPLLALSNKTMLHCHGYLQSPDDPDVSDLIRNNVQGTNHNILIADYRLVTYTAYPTAVLLAQAVAEVLIKAIEDMVAAGMNKTLLIITGFSMGGQIAGEIGRNLSFTLPELIALDPAGPLYNNTLLPSVSASDAACVKCIHTDGGHYGTEVVCGHQDYYPNNGVRYAPGCPINSLSDPMQACSHIRAQYFGGESSRYPNSFPSIECNSWEEFKAGNCNSNNIIPMGLGAPCSATGKFYLQTNHQSPFGLGQAGLTYNETLANIH